jgi:molecular chaperone GrpE
MMRSDDRDRRPEEIDPDEERTPDAVDIPVNREDPEARDSESREPDEADERAALMDRLLRLQAEFENFRKRSVRERAEWESRAKETIVLDLLPVVDSFDRALAGALVSSEEEGLRDGMMLVHKQLLDALKSHGVTPIEALGEPFDPNLHEAFLSRPAGEGEEPGTIVEEFATGYRMGDRVIRATKGIVAAVPESGSEPEPEEE